MFFYNSGEFGGDFVDGLIPGNSFKGTPDFFNRMEEAVGMVLIKSDVQPFAAGITITAPVILIPANLYDFIIFDSDLEPALISS
jgi:hypothetical protein